MALAAGGGGGEEKRRRILDYLNDGEDELVVWPSAAAAPRSLLPRFRWGRLVRLGKKRGGKEKVLEETSEEVSLDSSGCKPGISSSRSNLGAGLSLLFLLAKTSVEFNKMIAVRTQMEMLLEEIKGEVRRKAASDDDTLRNCALQSTASSCCTGIREGKGVHLEGNCALQSTASSCSTGIREGKGVHLEGHATTTSVEGPSCEKSSEEYESCLRMDMLEEEFEVELERLQLNFDPGCSLLLPEQPNAEPSDEFTDSGGSFSHNMEEIVEAEDEDGSQFYGVSALELERRLHEILHQRNQERIEELESALQCAERKLIEKERELCLQKDTAKLKLRHDDDLQ